MHQDWQPLLSTILGGTGVLWIARYYLEKSFKKLDSLPEDIASIEVRLAKVSTQLESLPEIKQMVQSHDRDISALKVTQRIKSLNGRAAEN